MTITTIDTLLSSATIPWKNVDSLKTNMEFVAVGRCLKALLDHVMETNHVMFELERERQFKAHCNEFYWMTEKEQIKTFKPNLPEFPHKLYNTKQYVDDPAFWA